MTDVETFSPYRQWRAEVDESRETRAARVAQASRDVELAAQILERRDQPRRVPVPRAGALQLPPRAPGWRVGQIGVEVGLHALYRALAAGCRGWPSKRRTRLERLLEELEDVLSDGGRERALAAAQREALAAENVDARVAG